MRSALPSRSARSCSVSGPVMTQSVGVFPSPLPLSPWVDDTETMCDVGAGSTRSVAITVTVTFAILWFGGQRLLGDAVIETMVGGVVSRTVTVNEPCAVLLCVSVAVHCTVVVPSGNVDPDA